MERLTEKFVVELLGSSIHNPNTFDIVSKHLTYTYLPKEEYKLIWKSILTTYDATNKIPSLGIIAEQNGSNLAVQKIIGEIRSVRNVDRKLLIRQFESFIKQSKFVELNSDIAELWEQGKKEDAVKLQMERSKDIHEFNLINKVRTKIFKGFEGRLHTRIKNRKAFKGNAQKIPTCIKELDQILKGGLDRGDGFLFTAQSGAGKSKFLKYVGVNAANLGYVVLHIQAEGTKEECEAGYDATWINMNMHDLRLSDFDDHKIKKLDRRVKKVLIDGGEIFIEACEKFGGLSTGDIRVIINELRQQDIYIDLLLVDYLEKINPVHPYKWKASEERERRIKIGDQLKDIGVEFNVPYVTATQASTVAPILLNNPEFVMTRYNISDVKKLVDAFSYHVTFNQTEDEYEEQTARLYMDKIRNYKKGQTLTISQDYNNEQFYIKDRSFIS